MRTIFLLLIIASTGFVEAAHWYVRPTAQGSDTGLDWNNACSPTSINAKAVAAGDTIWLAGGTTYTTGFRPTFSGTSGNHIFIKRVLASDATPASAAGWSAGFDAQVVIAPAINGGIWFNGSAQEGSYTTWDGRHDQGIKIEINDSASNAFYPAAIMIGSRNGSGDAQHDITFRYIDCEGDYATSGGTAVSYVAALSTYNWNGSGWRKVGPNILFEECRFHATINLAHIIAVDGMKFSKCKFYDNVFTSSALHANMFEINNSGNLIWENCEFWNWRIEGWMPYQTPRGPIYIYGCVIRDPNTEGNSCRVFENFTNYEIYIYNNVFENCVGIGVYSGSGGGTWNPNSRARNNIYINSNSYQNSAKPNADYEFTTGTGLTGANSINGGSNPFVDLAGNDFRIIETVSSVYPRNKGVALDDVGAISFATDYDGNTRGSDGTWDIGAFESAEDAVPNIQLSASTYSVGEAGGTVTITATRTGSSSGAVTADYATSNGTASAGTDYTAANGTLSWADMETGNKTFNITVANDSDVEDDETITVTLSNPTGGASLASPISATVTILDNDSAGDIQLSASTYEGDEDAGTITITVRRVNGTAGAVGVSYTTSNGTASSTSDYDSAASTLSWADGESTDKTFNITINDDGDSEGNETITVTISSATGGASLGSPTSATVTIVDDEEPDPPLMGDLTFEAEDGLIEAPFTSSGGYVYQTIATEAEPTDGGRARWRFTAPTTGIYTITCEVDAPSGAANSFFIDVDVEPTPVTHIWDVVTFTTGSESRTVTHRGAGDFDTPQFDPATFSLSAGVHTLIVRGREANTKLDSVTIIPPEADAPSTASATTARVGTIRAP